ncbi:hypothetical protein QBC38DRAFT_459962 [Podospora fimiseda]|uniref:Uncharacterized protein n=1 Tax=Podospora fimiseda TaxID=252190 RepID=A0AAN7BG36_9PEZI|nr:hypothetical protein QBC38DRAFT_459962 [Podospora fimiseda]
MPVPPFYPNLIPNTDPIASIAITCPSDIIHYIFQLSARHIHAFNPVNQAVKMNDTRPSKHDRRDRELGMEPDNLVERKAEDKSRLFLQQVRDDKIKVTAVEKRMEERRRDDSGRGKSPKKTKTKKNKTRKIKTKKFKSVLRSLLDTGIFRFIWFQNIINTTTSATRNPRLTAISVLCRFSFSFFVCLRNSFAAAESSSIRSSEIGPLVRMRSISWRVRINLSSSSSVLLGIGGEPDGFE